MPGWEGGSTWAWRKTRKAVLDRDRWRCQLTIPGICRTIADCAHHLDGKAAGDNPARIVAACTPCNLHVGDPTRGSGSSGHGGSARDPDPVPRTTW